MRAIFSGSSSPLAELYYFLRRKCRSRGPLGVRDFLHSGESSKVKLPAEADISSLDALLSHVACLVYVHITCGSDTGTTADAGPTVDAGRVADTSSGSCCGAWEPEH